MAESMGQVATTYAERWLAGWYQPYDPANGPGPIPNVMEYCLRSASPEGHRAREESELARYVVALVAPDDAERLGSGRDRAGLQLFIDGLVEWTYATLLDAAHAIEEYTETKVRLIEHRADLPYWTAHPREDVPV